jgi:hypothetical protein
MAAPKDKAHYQGLMQFLDDHDDGHMTDRERQFLDSLSQGELQKDIALDYDVKANTVSSVVGAASRRAAALGFSPNHDMVHPVAPGFRVKGTSTYYNADGVPTTQWVKTNAKDIYQREILEALVQSLTDRVVTAAPKARKKQKDTPSANGLLSAYMLGDPHFGALAWGKETLGDDWDTNIARDLHKDALSYLIDKAPPSEVGLLANLGDAFHADGVKPVTVESGNLLDTDSRLGYTIDALTETFTFAIERMLDRHGEVWVLNIRGNHDPSLSLAFNRIIDAYYRNEPRVKVIDNTPKLINLVWGKVLLSFHHTDKMPFQRWYEMLTRDHGDLWGASEYRYGHGGHVHHDQKKEIGGMLFHTHPTLAAADAWHAGSGYGAGRAAKVITYQKEFGEYETSTCDVRRIRP